MNLRPHRRVLLGGAIATMLATSLVACSAITEPSASSNASMPSTPESLQVGPDHDLKEMTIEAQPEIRERLPEAIKQSGVITVGLEANAGYPNSVTQDREIYGLTPDLAKAIGAVLDIEIDVQPGPFATLISGIQAGRYDMSTSLYFDREDRREILEMLDVQYSLGDLFVLGPKSDLEDLDYASACGVSVGVISSGSYIERLEEASKVCVDSGEPPVDINEFPSTPDAVVAVQSARVDAFVASVTQSSYIIASDTERLRPGSTDFNVGGYLAIAFPKGSDLVPAVREAMLYLNGTGQWEELLGYYGSERSAPTDAVIENLDLFDPENIK